MLKLLPLKVKLMILMVAPFLVIISFVVDKIQSERNQISDFNATIKNQKYINRISELVHEFQKERDFSVNYLLNPLLNNQVDLERQVEQTDAMVKTYRSYLIRTNKDTSTLNLFKKLSQVRNQIAISYQTDQIVENYYDFLIEELISIIININRNSRVTIIKDELVAQLALIQSKEYLGRIRNEVNSALVFNQFQDLGYGKFSGYKGAFETSLKDFNQYANKELLKRFDRDFSEGPVITTLEIIDYCFQRKNGKLPFYSSESWWISATGAINSLHELERFANSQIKIRLDNEAEYLAHEINMMYVFLGGTLVGLLILVIGVSRNITNKIKQIRIAAERLAKGEIVSEIPVELNDQIGELTDQLNLLSQNTNRFARIASHIGQGRYDVKIALRGENDVLGKALLKMREELQKSEMQLKSNLKKLQKSYQYKSEFLANMSHELRTPLNSILILSEVVAGDNNSNLNPDQKEALETITRSGKNLLNLINDILDVSKIESGNIVIQKKRFSTDQLKQELNDIFSELAKQKNIDYSLDFNSSIHEINSDYQKITQILKNLISNAIKFTPNKGSVRCKLDRYASGVFFEVKDNGIGIALENQKMIFEAFRQVDGKINRSFEGTGLGLSISKKLTAQLGGQMEMNSEIGKGTTFKVFFPIKNSFSSTQSEVEEKLDDEPKENVSVKEKYDFNFINLEQKTALTGKKIIFWETDISRIFALSAQLSKFSVEVIDASDFEEFRQKYKNNQPDEVWISKSIGVEVESEVKAIIHNQTQLKINI